MVPAELDEDTVRVVDELLLRTRQAMFEQVVAMPPWRLRERWRWLGAIGFVDVFRQELLRLSRSDEARAG